MGDFNFHIDWNKKQGKKPSKDLFLECMDENFLTQHVVEPTREKNILDLVVSTEENMIEDVQVGERFGSSDHQLIRFTIASEHEIEEIKHKKRFNYYRADVDKVRNKIKEKNLKQRLADLGVQDKWKKFASCMKEVVEETVPKYKRNTEKCPWVNKDVIKTRKSKYKAWKKMQTNLKSDPNIFGTNAGRHTEETRIKYVEKRNLANKSKRKAIKDYETKLSQNIKRDSKSFYNYMKSKQKRNTKIGPLKNNQDIMVTDNKETAEMLNKYFGSVLTQEETKNIPEPMLLFAGNQEQMINTVDITEEIVVKMLKSLKEDKTPRVDEMHPKFLKEVRNEIGAIIAEFFIESIKTGEIPKDWRDAIVTPLFKKGSRSDTSNYRPVSLKCNVCKVLEKIIKMNMVEHLMENEIIKSSQHGFMKGRSCRSNLLDFFEEVYENVDSENSVDIIYLDFAKAFD